MPPAIPPPPEPIISVSIARWAVATAPASLRTLLGSCVGLVLYDPLAKVGGLAHILLPDSRGNADHPGKYADTAIRALRNEMDVLLRGKARSRVIAKMAGGANMFATSSTATIGEQNVHAVERILDRLEIRITGKHVGGETGRRMTLNTRNGMVEVRIPGGGDVWI